MGPSALAISAALALFAQGAPAPPPGPTGPEMQTLRDYLDCQRAAVRALDDGHMSEDALARTAEPRCEAQYQAYRQAWIAAGGPGAPDERAWVLDNGRLERARMVVHASRRGTAMMAEIKTCVRAVADEFKAEPFERIVDRGVERCGAQIPVPAPPRGMAAAMTEQQVQERKARQARTTRAMIARQLRQVVQAPPQGG